MDNMMHENDQMMGHFKNEDLVIMIQDCEAICEHMTHHLKMMPNESEARVMQAILLRDCADICALTAKYVARDSDFAGYAASLCAQVCILCANECSKFNDEMSQHCAVVCYECARHCNDFALENINQ